MNLRRRLTLNNLAAGVGRSRLRLALAPVFGCFLSLLGLGLAARHFFPEAEPVLFMAAFGSSAVLIFTVPEIITAQPWPAVMGHVVAALAAVFVRENLGLPHYAAAPTAVALALAAMFLTRSLHPPAGGTAIAVLNADGLLGSYGYFIALFPMAAGMAGLVLLAVVLNNLLARRRYPQNTAYFRAILSWCGLYRSAKPEAERGEKPAVRENQNDRF